MEDPISGRGSGEAGVAPWTVQHNTKYFYFYFYRYTKTSFVFFVETVPGQFLKSGAYRPPTIFRPPPPETLTGIKPKTEAAQSCFSFSFFFKVVYRRRQFLVYGTRLLHVFP